MANATRWMPRADTTALTFHQLGEVGVRAHLAEQKQEDMGLGL